MQIEIAGWESAGLRCPNISVNLKKDMLLPSVALVQMPNGTGKTTTLELLQATLNGSARNWDKKRVCSYRRSHDNCLQGRFNVTLLMDSKPLTIELTLDYERGRATYSTTNPGSGGVRNGWHVPPSISGFLTPEFLSLFIFDGEFAGKLLDGESTEANRVVDALCQIYLLREVRVFARQYWENSAKADTTQTKKGLVRILRNRDQLEKQERDLQKQLQKAKNELTNLDDAIQEFQNKIDTRINSVEETRKRQDKSMAELHAAENEVVTKRGALMEDLRLPHAIHPEFSARLIALRDNLDQLRLPENTSAQFFEELVRATECICGRPMDEDATEKIRVRAGDYLDEEDAGVINALKRDIEQYTGDQGEDEGGTGHLRVLERTQALADALIQKKLAEQEQLNLLGRLVAAGDEELSIWQKGLEANSAHKIELENLVASIERPENSGVNIENTKSLREIREEINKLNDRIAQIKDTVKLRNQTEFIGKLLDSAAIRARDQIKQELVKECNQKLAVILENDPLVIEQVDRSIKLKGQRAASAGQSLAIGYTFLMCVLNRGQNDFPLVVDSPAGPIDRGVRRRIAQLLPSLCNQFVGFTINTEREGFVDTLERNVDDIRFLTLFRKTAGTQRMMNELPKGRYTETDNAVLVDDKAYFVEFDIKEEEE